MSHKLNPAAIGCLVFLIAATSATAAFNDYSMLFDGEDERVVVCDGRITDDTQGSISFWVKPLTLDPTPATSSYWPFAYGGNNRALIAFGIREATDDGNFYLSVVTYDYLPVPVWNIGYGSTVLSVGQWYHFVITSDGTTWKLYVNNNIETIAFTHGTNIGEWFGDITPTEPDITLIGCSIYEGGFMSFINGNIDEGSLWNKALSSNEVSEIYNNGYPGNLANHSAYSNLVSWWRMGDKGTWNGTNWSIPDLKGINTGISTNMEYSDRSQDALSPPIPSGTTFMAR